MDFKSLWLFINFQTTLIGNWLHFVAIKHLSISFQLKKNINYHPSYILYLTKSNEIQLTDVPTFFCSLSFPYAIEFI